MDVKIGRLVGSAALAIGIAWASGGAAASEPGTSVRRAYAAWNAAHESAGGDRSVRIPLRFAKGISVESRQAAGSATLDLLTRSIDVEIHGLDNDAEVWLIENSSGSEKASTLPGPGDRARLLGRVSPADARLAGQLRRTRFESFRIDRIVVCRIGEGPEHGILLTGSPSAFQRLYTRERRGELPQGATMGDMLDELVDRGRVLFEQETFEGNGRTCATCHPATNNFTIDPRFIATLPADDLLFVAEQVPELAELENPVLLRGRGLILENLDGFDRPGVLRGVPHTLALPTSVTGPNIPFDNTLNPDFGIVPPAERTGWGGDGAPGSGSLRDFATGAVIQHFPRSLARVAGQDFRLPTDDELDALEIFQLSLGRSADLDLDALDFRSPLVREGKEIFNRLDTAQGNLPAGKCSLCHNQAGANIDSDFFSAVLGAPVSGNANFGTGVNELAALPGEILDPEGTPQDGGFARVPHDGINCTPPRGGFGTVTPPGGPLPAGLCEEDFNTPTLVEAADTGPFFHNNAVDTIEAAVAFYNDEAFNSSAGGQLLVALDSGGIGIRLDTTEVSAVAGFLRVVNALENIRESKALARGARKARRREARNLLERVVAEERDAVEVLEVANLHPDAVATLSQAIDATQCARRALFRFSRRRRIDEAIELLDTARGLLVTQVPGT